MLHHIQIFNQKQYLHENVMLILYFSSWTEIFTEWLLGGFDWNKMAFLSSCAKINSLYILLYRLYLLLISLLHVYILLYNLILHFGLSHMRHYHKINKKKKKAHIDITKKKCLNPGIFLLYYAYKWVLSSRYYIWHLI